VIGTSPPYKSPDRGWAKEKEQKKGERAYLGVLGARDLHLPRSNVSWISLSAWISMKDGKKDVEKERREGDWSQGKGQSSLARKNAQKKKL